MRPILLILSLLSCLLSQLIAANWEIQSSGIVGSVYPTSVAFGNGRFVMGTQGQLTRPENAIAWSEDGYTWTPANLNFSGSAVVEFFNGYFYAHQSGVVHRSLNGADWVFVTSNSSVGGVARLASTSDIIVGSSSSGNFPSVYYSEDGFNWQTQALPQPTGGDSATSYRIVNGANRIWLSYDTTSAPPWTGLVAYSSNGKDWENLSSPLGFQSDQQLNFGNGRLVFISGNTVHVSTNLGTNFTTHEFPYNLVGAVRFAAGRFFGSWKLSSSLDGINWGAAAVPDPYLHFEEVAYGNGRYVAVGRNTVTQETPRDYIAVWETTTPPLVTRQPRERSAGIGRSTTFAIEMGYSATPLSYQWTFNGTPITSAVANSFTIASLSDQHAGWYACDITNAEGTITSDPVKLELVAAHKVSRLVNLSVRGPAGTDASTFISGFVVGGGASDAQLPLLIRGVGPTLNEFGVSNHLPDPALDIFTADGTKTASNNNWGGSIALAFEFARLGAFLFNASDSRDAALQLNETQAGPYSIHTLSDDGQTGIALSEVYDAIQTVTASSPRLINLSCRAVAGADADALTGGFVISGETTMRVMVRAVGPGLAAFGVAGTLTDPQVILRQNQNGATQEIATNDNWAVDSLELQKQVGAFDLPANSTDAVLIAELNPGVYSAQVSGASDESGIVLLEIYEIP